MQEINRQGWPQWQRKRYAYVGAAPAAGADFTITVPAGRVWEVVSIQASLTTSGVAGTRQVSLSLSDGQTVFLTLAAFTTQIASLTRRYTWFTGAAPYTISTDIVSQVPPLILQQTSVIASSTASKDTADQWTGPLLQVIETTFGSQPLLVPGLPDFVTVDAAVTTQTIPPPDLDVPRG